MKITKQTIGAAAAIAALSFTTACGASIPEAAPEVTEVVTDVVTDVEHETEPVEETTEPVSGIEALGYPSFATIHESGTGDQVIDLPADVTAGMVTATHNGTGHFAITGLDENNEFSDLLVNTIGAYEGVTAFGVHSLLPTGERLQVSADGDWTIEVSSLNDAPTLPDSGTGNGVFSFTGPAGTWAIEHTGTGHFSVIQYGTGMAGMNLLVNEIGDYSGSVAAHAGPAIVVVTSEGNWTIAK